MALSLTISLFKLYSRSIYIAPVKVNVVADDYVLSTDSFFTIWYYVEKKCNTHIYIYIYKLIGTYFSDKLTIFLNPCTTVSIYLPL